ncbi:DUF3025 domain-containing protein [Polyangium mundeleinium]|uniref:DUF3025 domain-containing protein n=1 Tax=Polyangium mundeleinium TaxID=2995306 RepID=A0ABT5ETW6_9BACT|nr:DUF3025 domain-containing protein [Polyangium mundeleinium]MDC0744894.1 DUF3025 domain-containing protein [Polyangium mundeleinium]
MIAWDSGFFRKSSLYWPIRDVAARFEGALEWPAVEAVDETLSEAAGVHFRLQPPRPRRRRGRRPVDPSSLYDARIHVEGWVPTRPSNWHDFLNALVWATFPAGKRALHARQHRTVAARLGDAPKALPDRRTREQDGLAMLDEGSLLLLADEGRVPAIMAALEARDTLAVQNEMAEGSALALVFGHALYESLLPEDRRSIWAMVALLPCPGPLPTERRACTRLADARLAELLTTPGTFSRPETFRSLPLDERVLCGESVLRREPGGELFG